MLKQYDFIYCCTISKTDGDNIDLIGYNSPYAKSQDAQSIDDIKFAILNLKVFDIGTLQVGETKDLKILCKFIEQKDKSFEQLFSLINE